MARRPALVASLALLALAACGPSKDPVVALLDELVEDASDRDADAVASHLSDDFTAEGADRAETVAMITRYLSAYQALDVHYEDLQTVEKAGTARASFTLKATGVPRNLGGLGDLLPRGATYAVEIVVRKEGSSWVIAQARWTPQE